MHFGLFSRELNPLFAMNSNKVHINGYFGRTGMNRLRGHARALKYTFIVDNGESLSCDIIAHTQDFNAFSLGTCENRIRHNYILDISVRGLLKYMSHIHYLTRVPKGVEQ